jgi:hypothetical protein
VARSRVGEPRPTIRLLSTPLRLSYSSQAWTPTSRTIFPSRTSSIPAQKTRFPSEFIKSLETDDTKTCA